MRYLLDTQVLVWSTQSPERLRPKTRLLLVDPAVELFFSVVSLWEIGVKRALKRPDFSVDPRVLRGGLLTAGLVELQITAEHAFAVEHLPPLHRDPFDRLLLCQAQVEGLTIVTSDTVMMQYPSALLKA